MVAARPYERAARRSATTLSIATYERMLTPVVSSSTSWWVLASSHCPTPPGCSCRLCHASRARWCIPLSTATPETKEYLAVIKYVHGLSISNSPFKRRHVTNPLRAMLAASARSLEMSRQNTTTSGFAPTSARARCFNYLGGSRMHQTVCVDPDVRTSSSH